MNVDGGVHDEDVYAIGDDEDDDEDEDEDADESEESGRSPAVLNHQHADSRLPLSPSPTSVLATPSSSRSSRAGEQEDATSADLPSPKDEPPASPPGTPNVPSKYYLQPSDTLHSISLRFKLDPQLICRLNNLPLSTLRSTPHLLHTRSFLTLPPSTASSPTAEQDDPQRDAACKREIARTRFRNVTKEVDWDVAKAYVTLAEHHPDPPTDMDGINGYEDEGKQYAEKEKKQVPGNDRHNAVIEGGSSLEDRAVDRYMDDDEWEQRERRAGRGVSIPRFPLASSGQAGSSRSGGSGDGTEGEKARSQWGVPEWMRWSPRTQ
ncbi:hypothetical protein EIP91_004405 [Steccherinum ochraceum]|uniref:LysM domain-containing protein n=1 Tax=Steccherinum ochraceum TaxID=92696 RepID=A0A4R0S1W4_9APHY|nr:hypothetical protein EIP91_004405 [Steccherinum ochraceum]